MFMRVRMLIFFSRRILTRKSYDLTVIPRPSANVRQIEKPGRGIRMFWPSRAKAVIHKSSAQEHPLHRITSYEKYRNAKQIIYVLLLFARHIKCTVKTKNNYFHDKNIFNYFHTFYMLSIFFLNYSIYCDKFQCYIEILKKKLKYVRNCKKTG